MVEVIEVNPSEQKKQMAQEPLDSDGESENQLQTFCELSTTLSSLTVYLWSKDNSQILADLMPNLETMFKSTDGKFKLIIRQKLTKAILAKIVIKDELMSLRIKTGLTQYAALDQKTLLLRFTLDSKYLNVSNICTYVWRTTIYRGPPTVQSLVCK